MPSPPALGAVGMTFTVMRAMQGISLIAVIGMASNFVSETVNAGYYAPAPLVGALVVACLAMLYIAITYILYWDFMLPMLLAGGADVLILIALIVVTVLVGKPVSYLKCDKFPDSGNTANFVTSVYENAKNVQTNVFEWVDPDKAACYEVKAVWGLSIALCILFAFSAITAVCLWRRLKPSTPEAPKDLE